MEPKIDCVVVGLPLVVPGEHSCWAALKRVIEQQGLPVVIRLPVNSSTQHEQIAHDLPSVAILGATAGAADLFNAVNQRLIAQGAGLSRLLEVTELQGQGIEWLSGIDLLVVDDRESNLELLLRILTMEGARVQTLNSGVSALESLQADQRHGSLPDAVLIDLQMPDMDGFETVIPPISIGLGSRTITRTWPTAV